MRTNETALVALCALVHIHLWNPHCDCTLLRLACAKGNSAPRLEGTDRQIIAIKIIHRLEHLLDKFSWGVQLVLHQLLTCCFGTAHLSKPLLILLGIGCFPSRGHSDLNEVGNAGINCIPIHLHNLVTLLPIHLLDGSLEQVDCFLIGHDSTELEEHALHDHVHSLAKTSFCCNLCGVDDVELGLCIREIPTHPSRQLLREFSLLPARVENADAAHLQAASHVVLGDIPLLVDCKIVRLPHSVRRSDGLRSEAQVTDGHASTLLGIILKVRLSIQVSVFGDELHSTLIRANSAITAKTIEHALCCAFRQNIQPWSHGKGQMGHIVFNANGEARLGSFLGQVFVDGKHHVWSKLLAPQSIAAANAYHFRLSQEMQGCGNLQQKRLAEGAWLLRAIQHAEPTHGVWQCCQKPCCSPRPKEPYFHHAHLRRLCPNKMSGNLAACNCSAAHHNNDIGCFWVSVISI
mmetsp:Transcript_43062/g.99074  ORF Transcript_43062/g.99074 Transcript_43062/m.99074 type:complete len:462 (+) Transcript_43062:3314-4699(+)